MDVIGPTYQRGNLDGVKRPGAVVHHPNPGECDASNEPCNQPAGD
ncbi:hypothetical protein ACVWYQ_005597 [Bradyrhizobium sp. USDA 3397]